MKKIVITVLILIIVPLYIFDVYMHNWTKQQLKKTVAIAFPHAQKIDVSLGGYAINSGTIHVVPMPMIPPLILHHRIPDITIRVLGGSTLGNVAVDDWLLTADSITFDSHTLFDSKRVSVREVSNGNVQLSISDRSLSNLVPDRSVTIDGSGHATVNINGQNVPLTVSVGATTLDFAANGQPFASIPYNNGRLLPCKPDAHFVSHELSVSCSINKVPGALTIGS
jgi:hypothetical protein